MIDDDLLNEAAKAPRGDGAQPDRVEAMLAKFVNCDQLKDIPPPKWLVEGVFHRSRLARISGHPGHGKSFVALDLACHVATDQEWHGRKVQKGRVIYMAAEGLSGLALRQRAWEQHHGMKTEGLLIYPEAVQVVSDDWATFVECCKHLGVDLIVIDTQARVTAGVKENESSDMGKIVERLDQLQRTTGATVLMIHHLTKSGESARGSGAVNGAMDSELVVSMNKTTRVVTMAVDKQKDGEEAQPVQFTLVGVPLGIDDEGNPYGSAVLTLSTAGQQTPEEVVKQELPFAQVRTLCLLALKSPTLGATKSELVKWLTAESINQATAYRAVDNLKEKGLLTQQGARFFLSEKAKDPERYFSVATDRGQRK